MTETEAYLQKKKLGYSSENDQFVLDECPFCDAKGHFYIDKQKGLFFCQKCAQRGNLHVLKRALGDTAPIKSIAEAVGTPEVGMFKTLDSAMAEKMHQGLLENPEALSYFLSVCGFSKPLIKKYKLGYAYQGGFQWVTIPHFVGDKLVNIKYRSLGGEKRFKREEGCESILFNQDCLQDYEEVFLVEGEKDALTLIDAGILNVVGVTAGANAFLPTWYDLLVMRKKVFICFDSDVVGQKGAIDVAKRLGEDICYNIVLSTNDVNDFWRVFQGNAKASFERIVEKAKPFGKKRVQSILDGFNMLERTLFDEGDLEAGLHLPWANMDRLVGPLAPGYLIGLTAIAKTGKTSFALEALYKWSYHQRVSTLCYCIEMSVSDLLFKIVTNHRDVEKEEIKKLDFALAKSDLWDIPLYFATNAGEGAPFVFDTIRYAVRRYGIKMVVFDNLHFLCRDIHNITAEVSAVVREFKQLAVELEVPIILVVQPRKTEHGMMPTMMDLRDSSSIATDVDSLIIMYRHLLRDPKKGVTEDDYGDMEGMLDPRCIIGFVSRYRAGGRTTLLFDGAKSKFYDDSYDFEKREQS